MTPSATITYLHHSGFTAVVANTLLVFDYWEGEKGDLPEHWRLTGEKLDKYDRVYVFISHTHPDHMDPKVFTWKCGRPITYIVSYDAPIGTRGRRIAPGDVMELDSLITVKAFGSTDLGVSFLVEAGGVRRVSELSGLSVDRVNELVDQLAEHTDWVPEPGTDMEKLDYALACLAVETAVTRHAGSMEETYTLMGLTYVQSGKDLRPVRQVVVTGGCLIHTARTAEIASHALMSARAPMSLKPEKAEVRVDRSYILAAMGLLSEYHPQIALRIMKKELENDGYPEQKNF